MGEYEQMITIKRIAAFYIDYWIILFPTVGLNILSGEKQIIAGVNNIWLITPLVLTLVIFKDVSGRSVGKRIMRLKIVDNGQVPCVWKRIVRNLSFVVWFVEFAIVIYRRDHRKLMDVILGIDIESEV